MPIKLSEADHRKLDAFLDYFLKGHASGGISLSDARAALAHVFTAAAMGNEGEVRAWLKEETRDEWKNMDKL